jgi:hypothetical protein
VPTRKPARVSASFTIQIKHLTAAEPGAPEESPEVGWRRCCRPTRQIIPSAIPKDVSAFLADSINQLRRGQLDPRVANGVGYLSSVLLRALEQGPLEERLAKIEAALAENAQQTQGAQRS